LIIQKKKSPNRRERERERNTHGKRIRRSLATATVEFLFQIMTVKNETKKKDNTLQK